MITLEEKMATEEQIQAIMKLREAWQDEDDQRDENLPHVFEGIERIDNLQYGDDKQWNLLDVYRPQKRDGKLPVIILIHGGNWCYGTKDTYQYYGMGLAQHGFAVVNASYRLAPQVVFPGELDDINRFVTWTITHADEYGFDLDNAFLCGDSAGGQMTLQYLTIWANPNYRKLFGYKQPQIKFRAGVLNCAPYFMLTQKLWTSTKAYYTDEIMQHQQAMVGTENHFNDQIPPLFIATANNDYLRDDSMKFAGFLMAKKHPHVAKVYGDEDHQLKHDFMINQTNALAKQATLDEIQFMKKYIK